MVSILVFLELALRLDCLEIKIRLGGVSILVFLELALRQLKKTLRTKQVRVSILVFLELALRLARNYLPNRDVGFQSLFSWNSLFDVNTSGSNRYA